MQLNKREFKCEEDFWRIRTFLRTVFLLNDRNQLSWPAARLDYWRWHVTRCVDQKPSETAIFLWETERGKIAAVLNQETNANVFLQIHPAYQNAGLLEEMVETAEQHLFRVTKAGTKHLVIWAHEHDQQREKILSERGFLKKENYDWQERQYQRSLDLPLPKFRLADGYTVRSLGGPEEIPSRSWASWRAFHPESPDEDYAGWDWYPINIQTQPLYRRDLDIVAIAPDGLVAAFTTLWYDDTTQSGYFEPVGTVPEHQKKGLGKAVIVEGMRRMKAMGALKVAVSGFSVPANKLYAAVFSEDCLVSCPWTKEWET